MNVYYFAFTLKGMPNKIVVFIADCFKTYSGNKDS